MLFLAIIAGVVTAVLTFRFIFSDKEEFFECIKYWLMPDIVSLFRGRYWDDFWSELKLFVWLGVSALVGFGVYSL